MKLTPKITLLDHFINLTDPRIDRSKDHKLIDIVAIAIRGMLCCADNWVAMEQYGNAKEERLKQFLAPMAFLPMTPFPGCLLDLIQKNWNNVFGIGSDQYQN